MDKGGQKKGERACPLSPPLSPTVTTTLSPPRRHRQSQNMRFVDVLFFFSTEFDEKDMTTVPGSHLVEPRVYSKASFLILFGGKF